MQEGSSVASHSGQSEGDAEMPASQCMAAPNQLATLKKKALAGE